MKTSVQTFFDSYAAALTTYSAQHISEFYQVPLTIYSDQGIQQVTKSEEVLAFWQQGIEPYKKQNIHKAVPQVISEEQLSKSIFITKVLWKNYDKSGKEVGNETNFYILSQKNDKLYISGLIIMMP